MRIVIYFFFIAAAIFIFLRYLEHSSIFYPSREIKTLPVDIGIPFENVFLTAADGTKLNAWFIKVSQPRATVILCHGNGGNIGDRLAKITVFRNMGFNVLIFDYRGYGKSRGFPSEKGLYLDALAAFDYALSRPEVDPKKLVIYGGSLGGAVAIELALRRKSAALVVDSSFTSVADMAGRVYPFIPSFLILTKFDSIHKVDKITVPKLFIHCPEDTVVPFAMSERLFAAATEPKEFLTLNGSHIGWFIEDPRHFSEGVDRFLKQIGI